MTPAVEAAKRAGIEFRLHEYEGVEFALLSLVIKFEKLRTVFIGKDRIMQMNLGQPWNCA